MRISGRTASHMASWVLAQMKPASSRATATTAIFFRLPCEKLPVAPEQAHLRVAGAVNDGLGDAFMATLDFGSHAGRVLVALARFHQQLSCIAVAVLGDAALTALVAR